MREDWIHLAWGERGCSQGGGWVLEEDGIQLSHLSYPCLHGAAQLSDTGSVLRAP